ncbi:MAG: hypothetical protein UT09_C0014G0010 [Parcubacteria group bacterium GW2011_GWF2_38_8]|nr:MAG: hypothetical protein UT09_C0014G0010 [Parcubacteria group bacterium GW2011_GWF2_38_8]
MRYPLYLRFTLVRDCQSGIMTSYPNMFAFQWKAAPCCQLLKSVLGYQRVSLCVLQLFARYMIMGNEIKQNKEYIQRMWGDKAVERRKTVERIGKLIFIALAFIGLFALLKYGLNIFDIFD